MAKKKRTTRPADKRKKVPSGAGGQRFKVLLAALFVSGFLVLCLAVLGHLREAWHTKQPVPVPVAGPAIEDIQLELDNMLWRAGISFQKLQVISEPGMVRYEVAAPPPDGQVLNALQRRLSKLSEDLRLESLQQAGRLEIYYRRELLFVVDFKPLKVVEIPKTKPRIAIIMDDLGHELRSAKVLIEMKMPVTFAILPYTSEAGSVARLARQNGIEALLHIPMEPRGYPAVDPGPSALLQTMNAGQLKSQLETWLDDMPNVVGGNNHMGSRLTEQRGAMSVVLETLQERGLFFVDSRTSEISVAVSEAHRIGIPVASRDVFLDNVRDVQAIAKEIRKLAGVARRRGSAIGICHPYPETLKALRQEAGMLREQGIEVVPVSQLVSRRHKGSPG